MIKIIVTCSDGLVDSVLATEECQIIVRDIGEDAENHKPYFLTPMVDPIVPTVPPLFDGIASEIKQREKEEKDQEAIRKVRVLVQVSVVDILPVLAVELEITNYDIETFDGFDAMTIPFGTSQEMADGCVERLLALKKLLPNTIKAVALEYGGGLEQFIVDERIWKM